jgi:hypothetical protein
LAYQLDLLGSYDRRTTGMCSEALIAEPWDGVGEAMMAGPIRHKRGLLVGCDAHTSGGISVGTLQGR